MSDMTPYAVTGRFHNGQFTYKCPTAEWALRKLRDFIQTEYTEIAVTGPDGQNLTEADLIACVENASAGGAPIDLGANRAPALAV